MPLLRCDFAHTVSVEMPFGKLHAFVVEVTAEGSQGIAQVPLVDGAVPILVETLEKIVRNCKYDKQKYKLSSTACQAKSEPSGFAGVMSGVIAGHEWVLSRLLVFFFKSCLRRQSHSRRQPRHHTGPSCISCRPHSCRNAWKKSCATVNIISEKYEEYFTEYNVKAEPIVFAWVPNSVIARHDGKSHDDEFLGMAESGESNFRYGWKRRERL